jgi:endonuclease/exonuclease/phosphatase family metal-dependent hydrolase
MTRELTVATWNIFGGRTWDGSRVDLDLPQAGRDEPRVALVAELADGGRRLTVAGTHLSFVPGPNLRQLRALQRHLDERGGPRLLLGDLNLWWPLVRVASRPGWS